MVSTSVERREVLYSGNVQGVGFRYSTRAIAANYDVVGFVRNMVDRRVQLLVEGTACELDRFLDDLADRMSGHVREAIVDVQPATGEFACFEIRY